MNKAKEYVCEHIPTLIIICSVAAKGGAVIPSKNIVLKFW